MGDGDREEDRGGEIERKGGKNFRILCSFFLGRGEWDNCFFSLIILIFLSLVYLWKHGPHLGCPLTSLLCSVSSPDNLKDGSVKDKSPPSPKNSTKSK